MDLEKRARALLSFRRPDRGAAVDHPLTLVVDGQVRAELSSGQEVAFVLSVGSHTLEVRLDGYMSEEKQFVLEAREIVYFGCADPEGTIRLIRSLFIKSPFYTVIETKERQTLTEEQWTALAARWS